jgi:hypothetical protein
VEWPERYAEALAAAVGEELTLTTQEEAIVLRLAREVAHRTDDRKNAPVASYLVGRFVAARVRAGASPREALDEAFALAERLLPPPAE